MAIVEIGWFIHERAAGIQRERKKQKEVSFRETGNYGETYSEKPFLLEKSITDLNFELESIREKLTTLEEEGYESPPPPANDTNPYNVFRPREKAHRLHTRRMQRIENNAQSFEKLRQVRRNLGQAKTILEALIKVLLKSCSSPGSIKQEARRHGWLNKLNPNEPVMLFTKPLVPNKLAAAGIIPPADSRARQFQGRIGRSGRILFDRWNPLKQTHINCGNSLST